MTQNRVRALIAIAWLALANASFAWAPVANNDSYSVVRNTTLSIAAPGVLANDMDQDGETLRGVLVNTTTNGVLTLNNNGSFTYRPKTNFSGSDHFKYKANDGAKDSGVAVVTITITTPPITVTKSPTNTTVCPGGTASFSVTASGMGLRYQWRKSSSNLAGQTNSSLVLPNVTAASAGTYAVVITGTSGSAVTNSAMLTVNTLVTATPLGNAVRSVGSVVIFSTTASGSSPITYQWRKNGTTLVGKTSSSLLLTNLVPADAGTYSVVVSGPCNKLTNSATLEVDYCFPAVDVALVIDRSGSMLGQPFTDARTASSNFVKNLKFGVTNDRAALVSYSSSATLDRVLTNSATSLNGAINTLPGANGYTCISCGIATAQAELMTSRHNPEAMPVLVLLSDGMPTAGDTASEAIEQATLAKNAGTRVFSVGLGDVDHALMRGIASSTNDYFYATNSSQLTALFNAISSIICRPPTNIFVIGLTNQTVCSGATVAWSITASNCDSFTYQWRKDGANLVGQTNRTLTLPNVSVTNGGVYSLIVGSSCQTLTNSATLTVNQTLLVSTPPANRTSVVGSNATFSVSAIGTGISYQWR
ncbi:MAG TPA: VWA domain-containing protein, partial [Candidatus Acidoferrum sp.]|nr:VWA domain-containing protein [Candidatus Acidoferrum sp.]